MEPLLARNASLTNCEPFSIRDWLSKDTNPYERLRDCLWHAKTYLEPASVVDILDMALERPENHSLVEPLLIDSLHVGFLFPHEGLTSEGLGLAASEAGFSSTHATFPSAVVARELGYLAGCAQVPTTVFSSSVPSSDGGRRYVEVFLPVAEPQHVQDWSDREVATHIGMTLAKPSDLVAVHEVFAGEGYRIPAFMEGQSVINPSKGVSVTYFEKDLYGKVLRIEFMSFLKTGHVLAQ